MSPGPCPLPTAPATWRRPGTLGGCERASSNPSIRSVLAGSARGQLMGELVSCSSVPTHPLGRSPALALLLAVLYALGTAEGAVHLSCPLPWLLDQAAPEHRGDLFHVHPPAQRHRVPARRARTDCGHPGRACALVRGRGLLEFREGDGKGRREDKCVSSGLRVCVFLLQAPDARGLRAVGPWLRSCRDCYPSMSLATVSFAQVQDTRVTVCPASPRLWWRSSCGRSGG